MNSCVLKHPFFWGSAATKQSAQKPWKFSLRRATNVTFSKFCGWGSKKKRVVWNRASHCFNWSINSGPKILRSCLLHCTCPEWIHSEGVYFRAQNGRRSKVFRVLYQKTNKQTNNLGQVSQLDHFTIRIYIYVYILEICVYMCGVLMRSVVLAESRYPRTCTVTHTLTHMYLYIYIYKLRTQYYPEG